MEVDAQENTPNRKAEIPTVQRLLILSRTVAALGETVKGLTPIGPTSLVLAKEVVDQIILITKRITWIEKSSDPDYKPLDPESPKGKLYLKRQSAEPNDRSATTKTKGGDNG